MQREPVTSSNLRSVGYDPASQTLEVEFLKSGAVYQYSGVPEDIYRELMAAESHGRYFFYHIRNAYAYRRIS